MRTYRTAIFFEAFRAEKEHSIRLRQQIDVTVRWTSVREILICRTNVQFDETSF